MENNTNDIQSSKKSGKMFFVKSIILSASVIVAVVIIVTIVLRYRSSNRLSKIERECYNDVVMLYNESISSSYNAVDSSNEYEHIVCDTASHMRMMENMLISKSFKYKEAKESSNPEYKNQVTLTYTGLNSIKTAYTLWYVKVDEVYSGLIKCDGYNVGSFAFQEDEDGYKTSLLGGNGEYTYSLSLKGNLYSFAKTSTSDYKTTYTYNTKTDILKVSDDEEYTFGLNGTSIQITKTFENEAYVASVSIVTKDQKYMYEYQFLASGKDQTKYNVSR